MHYDTTPDSGQESVPPTKGEERDDSRSRSAHDPLQTEMGLDPLRCLD